MSSEVRYPSDVEEWLRGAGWYPERRNQVIIDDLERCAVPRDHPAYRALAELGGLHLRDASNTIIRFDLLPDDEVATREVWTQLLGTQLVGLGETDNDHAEAYIAEDGRVFGNSLVHDAFFYLGGDLSDALTGLLRKRRSTPMLRPDQTEVMLYGQAFTAGHAGLYQWQR